MSKKFSNAKVTKPNIPNFGLIPKDKLPVVSFEYYSDKHCEIKNLEKVIN